MILKVKKIVKKLVVLSQSDIDYIQKVSKSVSDPRAKNGNFSAGLRYIIEEYKKREDGN